MYQLHKLTQLVKKRKKIGRGGSRGGTSGRGHKGQKARTGHGGIVRRDFEGGQMPLIRKLPKRGFKNTAFAQEYEIINLSHLDAAFEPGAVVTTESLVQKGLLKKNAKAYKVLGKGTLSKKLQIHAHAVSESALKAIQKIGGQVHFTREE
jgi:large subunit ribosomal protein L15